MQHSCRLRAVAYNGPLKRLFDLLVGGILAIVSLPLALMLAIWVQANLGPPILFRQQRPGLHGRPFTLYKFRTMTDARDSEGNLLPDAERLTSLGRFLRATSLDELPTLFNVIKGDMSLVGPRPLLMHYLPLYSQEQMRRHEVRPGITGWAQVHGRNRLDWLAKFEHDVWYVDNLSFWLDVKILVMTVLATLRREGISQEGHVTSREFTGN